jgi:hypothetical protein
MKHVLRVTEKAAVEEVPAVVIVEVAVAEEAEDDNNKIDIIFY